ncbi:hypothetical protein FLAG1_10044 [Fusarium langsethiae]|uniref:Enoyl reductase (ER) domain-containing protein n=1 Tax=Fusarium langsethiae TaxID=179993 RepID=A0A0N0DBR2_FUSLA|nr:hypothetical protein FLAG1_10044 [Fusarium langsethiae]GKU08949.1 unnamed protein product [Fusarium langsethiae]
MLPSRHTSIGIPKVTKHEVLIKVHAVSSNFRDITIITSKYSFQVTENVVPCSDMAGDGEKIGECVKGLSVGDKAVASFDITNLYGPQRDWDNGQGGPIDGVLRQYVVLPASAIVKVPSDAPQTYSQLASVVCMGTTVWNSLYGNLPLRPGHVVLCQGTGGVSITATILAKAAGATVIITSSSDEKLALAKTKFGADHGINYKTSPDWAAEALELTGLKAINYGDVAGLALSKGAVVRGITVGSKQLLEEAITFISKEKLRLPVEKEFPFTLEVLPNVNRVRTFILTDILNEPDDKMSLVRYLLYSNEFDTRGIVAVTSWSLRNETHPGEIKRIIESYGKAALKQPISDGARNLVKALRESTEPLYISLWGGANTLAQALQHIDKTETKRVASQLRSRLRVYAISDQDDTGPYIRVKWPDVFYIVNVHGYREYSQGTWTGISTGDNNAANRTKVLDDWLTPNIRLGPLGAEYPKIIYTMEGDSPNFIWTIQNGLNVPGRPEYGGWGGRYTRVTEDSEINEYATSADTLVNNNGENWRSHHATIWRWRDAYQDDFAAHMQWTIVDRFEDGAHPPKVYINGYEGTEPLRFQISLNDTLVLNASETYDTDNLDDASGLTFEWYSYAECALPFLTSLTAEFFKIEALSAPSETNGTLSVNEAGFSNATLGPVVRISTNLDSWVQEQPSAVDKEWHIILQVTNNKGSYPVRRYGRVILEIPEVI